MAGTRTVPTVALIVALVASVLPGVLGDENSYPGSELPTGWFVVIVILILVAGCSIIVGLFVLVYMIGMQCCSKSKSWPSAAPAAVPLQMVVAEESPPQYAAAASAEAPKLPPYGELRTVDNASNAFETDV
eukprot:m.9761 g.9761  ORF g.9761 m.9761 type:complete len:131 (+) comp5034_c0_seq1:115-507(+)